MQKVEKPDLHTNELGHRKDLFQVSTSEFFQVVRAGLSKLLCSIIIQG